MTIHLPLELRELMQSHPNEPLTIRDETTQADYVVLPLAMYEQMQSGSCSSAVRDAYPLIDAAWGGTDGWDAPGMEMYDRYDEFRPGVV